MKSNMKKLVTRNLLAAGFIVFVTSILIAPFLVFVPPVGLMIAGATFAISLISWLVGPWILDKMQKYTMNIDALTIQDFSEKYPEHGQFIKDTCKKYNLPTPSIRLINSMTPTAYTYGSFPSNARVAFSVGLLQYLEEDEAQAVIGHEIGHIKHYDFILISLLVTALAIIRTISQLFFDLAESAGKGNKKGGQEILIYLAIGIITHLLWIICNFVVLYISRIREYMADMVGAESVNSSSAMQRALVKIGYGMLNSQKAAITSDPNVLIGRTERWSFFTKSDDAFQDWQQSEENWAEEDAATSTYGRKVFDVPALETAVFKVNEGWFKFRPPNALSELPDMELQLFDEGVVACSINGQPLIIEEHSVSIPTSYLQSEDNILGVKVDLQKAAESGSFRLQMGWRQGNVFKNSVKKDLQTLESVQALNIASNLPSSTSYITDPTVSLGEKITPLMIFDLKNPWARFLEIFSTHPLIGNRLMALHKLQTENEEEPFIDEEKLRGEIEQLDNGRLVGMFIFELFVYFLPTIAFAVSLGAGLFMTATTVLIPFIPSMFFGLIGIALLLKGLYSFSVGQDFKLVKNIYQLMIDPYMNPLRGQPVAIRGHILGKQAAGSFFGEDITIMDEAGGVVYVNYESVIPIFGNLMFGARQLPALIGEKVLVRGWFRRGQVGIIDAHELILDNFQVFCSATKFWAVWQGVVLISFSVAGLSLVFPPLILSLLLPIVIIVVAYLRKKSREKAFPKDRIKEILREAEEL